jgi:hypothetical protein
VGRREVHKRFWWVSEGKNHLVDGKIILKMDLQELRWSMEWIDLDHDRDVWPTIMNAKMNLRVPQHVGKS